MRFHIKLSGHHTLYSNVSQKKQQHMEISKFKSQIYNLANIPEVTPSEVFLEVRSESYIFSIE